MKIMCLCGSNTYGYGVKRIETWESLASALTGHTLINKGITGDTTAGMLARLYPDVFSLKPEYVIDMGGGNDFSIGGQLESAKSNVFEIVNQARANGVVPILGIPVRSNPVQVRKDWAQICNFVRSERLGDEFSEWLKLLCRNSAIPSIDFRAQFDQAVSEKNLYLDGLHPTPRGHRIMAEAVEGAFSRL